MQAVNLNTILQHGGMYNPAVNICSYLNVTTLSHVSKAFRRANLQAMVLVCERLNLSHPEKMQMRAKDAEKIASGMPIEEFEEELFTGLSKSMREFLLRVEKLADPYYLGTKKLWDDLLGLRKQVLQGEHSQMRAELLNMLVCYISPLKEQFQQIENCDLTEANVLQTCKRTLEPVILLLRVTHVQRSFAATAQRLGDFHLPKNALLCFAAFCDRQKQLALANPSSRVHFPAHAQAFHLSFDNKRFIGAERLLIRNELFRFDPPPPAPTRYQRMVVALRWGFARIATVFS